MTDTAQKFRQEQAEAEAIDAPLPAFATIDRWCALSGMSRRATYDDLGEGNLHGVKRGTRTLIDVRRGIAYLRSLPPAKIRAPRERQAEAAEA